MIIECAKIVLDYEYARTSKERVDHNENIKFVATCVIQPYILLGEELPSNP